MKLTKDIELIDLALYTHHTLIVSDFHIGYEEALNKQGVFVPRFQFKEIIDRLDTIFSKLKNKKIETIVIAGDLKHEFGYISDQEWRHTLRLIDYFSKKCEQVVLLKGNHDKILEPIAAKRKVSIVDYFLMDDDEQYVFEVNRPKKGEKQATITRKTFLHSINEKNSSNNKTNSKTKTIKKTIKSKKAIKKQSKNQLLVVHGDIIPEEDILTKVKTIVMGHEHPAVTIKDTTRSEKFKCFLIGKFQKQKLIVVPSFNLVTEGTDVTKERLLSPFLKQDLKNFKAIVVGDKLYDFGKLKGL